MPIYEYKCTKCNKVFEEHQSHKDKPVEKCKFCQSPVKRVFSPVGISFKGSGFYVNDSAKKERSEISAPKSLISSEKSKPKEDASSAKK